MYMIRRSKLERPGILYKMGLELCLQTKSRYNSSDVLGMTQVNNWHAGLY